jgi:hypothetical protein
MNNYIQIITKKTHSSSINKLGKIIPKEILEYVDYDLLLRVSTSLSDVTKNSFLYTGIIKEGKDCLHVEYKSADKIDTVSMIIHYDISLNENGFDFEGLNEQMEKAINEPDEVVVPEIVKEKVKTKKKPKKKKVVEKIDPKALDKVLDSFVEKETKISKAKVKAAFDNAMDNIVEKEKTKQKTKQVIDLLEKITDDESDKIKTKKEINPIDILKKIVSNEKK